MAVIIKPPLDTPSISAITLSVGGSLSANTTYYLVITATTDTGSYPFHDQLCSSASQFYSFTTTSSDLTAYVEWNPVNGASAYDLHIFSSTANLGWSPPWQGRLGWMGTYNNGKPSTTDTNYTITGTSSVSIPFHTFQQQGNNYVGGIDLRLGRLHVDLSGTESLTNIATALSAAGYGNYVYREDQYFAMKGSIVISSTASGSLYLKKEVIWMYDGFIQNSSASFFVTLGEKQSFNGVDFYANGCWYFQEGNTLLLSTISAYDTSFQSNQLYSSGHPWGLGSFAVAPYTNGEIVNCHFGPGAIPTFSTNVSTAYAATAINCNFMNGNYVAPSPALGELYNCKFYRTYWYIMHGYKSSVRECLLTMYSTAHLVYTVANDRTGDALSYDMYDCNFPDTADNLPVVSWSSGANGQKDINIFNSLLISAVDGQGNPIEAVRMIVRNNVDEILSDQLSSENGQFQQVDCRRMKLNHLSSSGAGIGTAYTMYTNYNPMSVTLTKQGFETYTSTFVLLDKTKMTITLRCSAYGNIARH